MADMVTTEQEIESMLDRNNKRYDGAVKHLMSMAAEKVKKGDADEVVILRQINADEYKAINHLTKSEPPFIELTTEDAYRILEDRYGPREGVIIESGTKRTLGDFLDALRKGRKSMLQEFGGAMNGFWFVASSQASKKVLLEYHGSSEVGDTWQIKAHAQDPDQDRFNPSIKQHIARVLQGGVRKNG